MRYVKIKFSRYIFKHPIIPQIEKVPFEKKPRGEIKTDCEYSIEKSSRIKKMFIPSHPIQQKKRLILAPRKVV